jgi:hypothetical protein
LLGRNGDDLGSMKNECLEKVEGYYKNKIIKELGEDIPKEYSERKSERIGGKRNGKGRW